MKTILSSIALLVTLAAPVYAHDEATLQNTADIQLKDTPLATNLYMLSTDIAGNMAALVGPEGVLLVDSQFAQLAGLIRYKLDQLSGGQPLSRLINTHFHPDHVNGNSALAAGIEIIAHDNVLARLQQDAAFPEDGLPTTTFNDTLTLLVNGHTLRLVYMPPSHTDGDIVIWFDEANVIHMGDMLFADMFPFIDMASGGSVRGYIENTRTLLNLMDNNTKVIPGHGQLTNKKGVRRSLHMLEHTLGIVQGYKRAGLTEQQVVDKGLGKRWESWSWSFVPEERWIRTLYNADVDVANFAAGNMITADVSLTELN